MRENGEEEREIVRDNRMKKRVQRHKYRSRKIYFKRKKFMDVRKKTECVCRV